MKLAHNVFFTLKPDTLTADELVAACHKYLTGHPGTVFFACGVLTPDLAREVNDRDFEVGLHVVFEDRAAHDAYQVAERHKAFIEECKHSWDRVRVFDTDVETGAD